MLSIGIVGLPNVGKSTLFNALTKKAVDMANYPFCTIDPSVGVVVVPDERLYKLAEFSKSAKVVSAVVQFVDIAGLVKGASEGEGLGNKFLSHIREVDAIAQVVRIFEDDNIIHVSGRVDPVSDIETINLELVLADLEVVTKRLGNIEREVKRGEKEALAEEAVLKKLLLVFEAGRLSAEVELTEEESRVVKTFNLLTRKPILYVLNRSATARNLGDDAHDVQYDKLIKFIDNASLLKGAGGTAYVTVDAGLEQELKDFSSQEKKDLRQELGVAELDDGVDRLIKAGYSLLDLISFFTTGTDETRAWTISRNASAPEAGMAIHTDFRDKFIRAEVINWETLLNIGSYAQAREKGVLRTEGKTYIVQDGDVIEFRI